MLPWKHFVSCMVLAVALFPFFGAWSLLVFASGFLIDADHVLYYLWRFREFDLRKTYWWFRRIGMGQNRHEYGRVIRPFHNVEVLCLLVGLALIIRPLAPLPIGWTLHIIMDMIEEYQVFGKLKNYSLLVYLFKRKTL